MAGDPIQVGALGDPIFETGPVPTNPDATGDLTHVPFTVTEVVMSAPGGMAGVLDVNWLDPSRKGTQADRFAQNLALFLSGSTEPPGATVNALPKATTPKGAPRSSLEPHPTTADTAR